MVKPSIAWHCGLFAAIWFASRHPFANAGQRRIVWPILACFAAPLFVEGRDSFLRLHAVRGTSDFRDGSVMQLMPHSKSSILPQPDGIRLTKQAPLPSSNHSLMTGLLLHISTSSYTYYLVKGMANMLPLDPFGNDD